MVGIKGAGFVPSLVPDFLYGKQGRETWIFQKKKHCGFFHSLDPFKYEEMWTALPVRVYCLQNSSVLDEVVSCGYQTSLWLCVCHSTPTPLPPNVGENPLGGACGVVCESPAMEELVNCFSAQSKESAPGGIINLPESSPSRRRLP